MLLQATEIQDLSSDIVEMEDMLDDYLIWRADIKGKSYRSILVYF